MTVGVRCIGKKLFYVLCLSAVGLLVATPRASAQEEEFKNHVGLPTDWSTKRVLYPRGASLDVAAAASSDPRSWANSQRLKEPSEPDTDLLATTQPRRLHRDWAISLGSTAGMAAGETPAKYSFNINGTYSCANDFVVYTIQAAASATQANIVAFNNLYTGTASSSCPNGPQTPPTTDLTKATFMWSYAVAASPIYLSPIISLNGTKVGFVEGGAPATLDVLTWVRGQGTDATHPATPGTGGSSVFRLSYTTQNTAGCVASSATNTKSSAYIDYARDVVYVGADNGRLYRITGVFTGTPTVQYCVIVSAGSHLTSPVYNFATNQVFISDGLKVYSYVPGATGFTLTGSTAIATSGTNAITMSPMLDSTNGFVYVFSGTDSTNTHSVVAQLNLALTSQTTAQIGSNASQFILDGDFDNAYYTTGPKAGAGTLYACGRQPNNGGKPSLYALSFRAPNGIMNATPAMSDNRNINVSGNPNGSCSPLLDFFDGTTDRLFVGAGNYTGNGGANLVSEWNVNTRIPLNTTMPNATATNEWGGTTAFAVDNISTAPQTANIYFGTLVTPGNGTSPCGANNYCAVKLTRSGLQ
jgi:hypothetical protein